MTDSRNPSKPDSRLQDWFEERVEAYVSSDLDAVECQRFEQHLAVDLALQRSVANARAIAQALRQVPDCRAPASLKRRVFAATGTQLLSFGMVGGSRQRNSGWWVAAAAALVLAISTGLHFSQRGSHALNPSVQTELSASEIAQGREDLAVAMAYLDQATTLASRKVSSHWVNDGLVRPLSAGLKRRSPAVDGLPSEDGA